MTRAAAEDAELFTVAAALLDTGREVGRLSRALTVLAFAGLLAPLVAWVPPGCLGLLLASAAAGLGGAYAGARVHLDAALFRHLGLAAGGPALLDAALLELGLLGKRKAGRPLAQRVAGARRLLRVQVMALAVQAGGLAAAGLWRAAG